VVKPPEWLVKNVMPSDNIDELRRMGRDPNMIWGARSDTIYGLVGLMEQAWRKPGELKVPTPGSTGQRPHHSQGGDGGGRGPVWDPASARPSTSTAGTCCWSTGRPKRSGATRKLPARPGRAVPVGRPTIPTSVKAMEAMVPKPRKTASGL
jgi:acylglycerol lipase